MEVPEFVTKHNQAIIIGLHVFVLVYIYSKGVIANYTVPSVIVYLALGASLSLFFAMRRDLLDAVKEIQNYELSQQQPKQQQFQNQQQQQQYQPAIKPDQFQKKAFNFDVNKYSGGKQ